ncbi:MAG: VIT domain-containing protein [Planctomycetota bacterium]|jgi:hypothetical protein
MTPNWFVRFSLILAVPALVIAACALWPSLVGPNIRPGGGDDTPLAKALEQGRLSEATAGQERADPPRFPGPAAPTTPAPARTAGEGMPEVVAEAEEEEEEAEPTGEEADERAAKDETTEAGRAGRPHGVRFGAGDEKGKDGKDLPVTGRWQRGKQRPSFARVHIGSGNSLDLVRMRVTVTIEGARARTVVDHIFRNPHEKQLEGTFEYPLPASAAASYFAMFLTARQEEIPEFFTGDVIAALPADDLAMLDPADATDKVDNTEWGELREARVVAKEKARRTYEEIVRRKIDPALLEYAGGNTFRGRVFPIQPHGLNRVIVAYEQHLDIADGSVQYRFPLPDCDLEVLDLTLVVDKSEVKSDTIVPKGAARRVKDGRVVYQHAWESAKGPGGELVLSMVPQNERMQVTIGKDPAGKDPAGKGRSFYARIRPDIPVHASNAYADRAVFLLDTSFSEEPDRFHANLEILKQILHSDADIKLFNIACFDAGAAWVEPDGWVTNDAAGRSRALRKLDDVLLEGATDLSAAVDLLDATRWRRQGESRAPGYVFLLTDGQVNWGKREASALATDLQDCALIRPRVFCYRTGISAENLTLFRKLTANGGGIFNVLTEAMAKKVGLAHRRPAFLVERVEVAGATDVLVAGRKPALFPGGEIVVAGRYADAAKQPGEVVLHGRFGGAEKSYRFPLQLDGAKGTLADRAWAEIAVNQMLALDDAKVEPLAVAYAQRYHIGSRVTSFLVLEKDSDYKEFKIAKEASSLAVKDMAGFLDKRYREGPRQIDRKATWTAFLAGRSKGIAEGPPKTLLDLLHEQDLALPPGAGDGVILRRSEASNEYLEARDKDRRKVRVFVDEAARRSRDNRKQACVRVLSTVVENHPGRSDAMRLVGYRLLSLGQSADAAHIFDRVRLERPFEPHSYRDLARSLEQGFRYPLAALQYEILLAGKWHERFESLQTVVRTEYAQMLADALRSGSLSGDLMAHFRQRQGELAEGDARSSATADLRVTVSWNTDNTDVDLWVVEPNGEACGYQHQKTSNGGQLLDDLTGGYGPERYQIIKAPAGEFVVLVHNYGTNPNLIAGETHVEVVVERLAGSKDVEKRRFQVVLHREGQAHEVCKVRF